MIIDTEKLWAFVKINKTLKFSNEDIKALLLLENSIKLIETIAKEIESEKFKFDKKYDGFITREDFEKAKAYSKQ